VLIPTSISTNTTLTDLRASFDPTNAVALYARSSANWANSTVGLSATQAKDLTRAWWNAVRAAPFAYLYHRATVIIAMLGVPQRDMRTGSAITVGTRVEPAQTAFKDNPTRSFWSPSGVDAWRQLATHVAGSALGAPLATLLAAMLVSAAALAHRTLRHRRLNIGYEMLIEPFCRFRFAGACFVSGALYFAGLVFAAPTADMRYIFWPVVAVLLTAAFLCSSRPTLVVTPAAGAVGGERPAS
jgi:hypothetical protein